MSDPIVGQSFRAHVPMPVDREQTPWQGESLTQRNVQAITRQNGPTQLWSEETVREWCDRVSDLSSREEQEAEFYRAKRDYGPAFMMQSYQFLVEQVERGVERYNLANDKVEALVRRKQNVMAVLEAYEFNRVVAVTDLYSEDEWIGNAQIFHDLNTLQQPMSTDTGDSIRKWRDAQWSDGRINNDVKEWDDRPNFRYRKDKIDRGLPALDFREWHDGYPYRPGQRLGDL